MNTLRVIKQTIKNIDSKDMESMINETIKYKVSSVSDLLNMAHLLYNRLNSAASRVTNIFVMPDIENFNIRIKVYTTYPISTLLDKVITFNIAGTTVSTGHTIKEMLMERKIKYSSKTAGALHQWLWCRGYKSEKGKYSEKIFNEVMSKWMYTEHNNVTLKSLSAKTGCSYGFICKYFEIFGLNKEEAVNINVINAFKFIKPMIVRGKRTPIDIIEKAKLIAQGKATLEQIQTNNYRRKQ